jgi:hypothetical protein
MANPVVESDWQKPASFALCFPKPITHSKYMSSHFGNHEYMSGSVFDEAK